ncbi:hypothetical protein P4B35_23995, partial [Pontiellaceae bacterium B12227]|nr:hypothetical protein [Pontiellaceae bacterium B12227]
LSSTLDLTSKRGLGLWVTGDGSGATMVIRLSRFLPKGRDYVVPINFTGRRWIEIPTGEQGWRAETWGFANETLKYFDYNLVKHVSIWVGHLPANTSCNILVEDLTALAEIQEPLVNPTVTLGEQSLSVNITIPAENHFILEADGTFTVYDEWWNGVYTQQLASALLPSSLASFSIQSASSS